MITPVLEKLILCGDASFRVHTHALGMFGRIPMQEGKLSVITKIIWNNFIDFEQTPYTAMSYLTWLAFNEYQLKIQSSKNTTVYSFRNSLRFNYVGSVPLDLSSGLAADFYKNLITQPGDPVVFDTFVVCSNFTKITISRNKALSEDSTVGFVSKLANEQPAPNGVADLSVPLKIQHLDYAGTALDYYYPEGVEYSGLPPSGTRQKDNYVPDFEKAIGANLNSQLSRTNSTPNYILRSTTPLVNFEIVDVNENVAKQVMSTL